MISALSSQLPKSVMKTCKHAKSSHVVKSKPLVELEDDEDTTIQPFLAGVPDVVLPWLSNSPQSPRVPTKKPFGPATVIAGSHPVVIEPSQPTPGTPVQAPPVIDVGGILIPELCVHTLTQPTEQPMLGLYQAKLALHNLVGQEDQEYVYVIRLLHNKEDQVHSHNSGYPAKMTPSKAPSKAPPISQSKAQTHTLLSLSLAVPAAALDLPMLDLHAMAIAIQDGTAHIAIHKAHMAEQDRPPVYNQVVHPEVPDTSSEIVDLGDPSNLIPEYNSSNDMDVEVDVEVKVEVSSEEVGMVI
ncbi:uncharacterized protein BJ212DRAFT_1295876 [Suillus subaureus]|uniref:Uncharacterized protein n=1 Tax=Suillus subaureus TaxID=48587 RepID=A0A9P7ELG0_9AGAM|nr:uncharacterized protein BJ212DRAFT_1295876 [Suillus subaureus]KAG1824794.1 hypothetical protein BJ212DRAFT_1295876 [Suillus subaureus]